MIPFYNRKEMIMDIMRQAEVWEDMQIMKENTLLHKQIEILTKFLDSAYPTCPPDDKKICVERKKCYECWDKWSYEKAMQEVDNKGNDYEKS